MYVEGGKKLCFFAPRFSSFANPIESLRFVERQLKYSICNENQVFDLGNWLVMANDELNFSNLF